MPTVSLDTALLKLIFFAYQYFGMFYRTAPKIVSSLEHVYNLLIASPSHCLICLVVSYDF